MGVYIKGLTLNQLEKIDGIVWGREGIKLPPERVVEVPEPHGRLIDADVYKSQFQYWGKYDDECLDETPTVIEAERKKVMDRPTEKQLEYIRDMQEFSAYPLPEFTGKTKKEASEYIDKHKKLAHEDVNSPMFGY